MEKAWFASWHGVVQEEQRRATQTPRPPGLFGVGDEESI